MSVLYERAQAADQELSTGQSYDGASLLFLVDNIPVFALTLTVRIMANEPPLNVLIFIWNGVFFLHLHP